MNRKRTVAPLLVLLLVLAAPRPAAAEDEKTTHDMSPQARLLDVDPVKDGWFGVDAATVKYANEPYDAQAQLDIYDKKYMNKTAFPFQWGIRLYDRGAYTPRPTWLGAKNPIGFHFLSYGDVRVAGAYYDNGSATDQSVIAARLNLDMDVALTPTERLHAFVRPLDKGGSFTRYQLRGPGSDKFVHEFDFDLDTLFFEGDAGAITQGLTNRTNAIDLPIAFGRLPIVTQNGVWIEDAVDGAAIGITAKNSPRLDVSNTDVTFFAALRNVNTAAVPGNTDSKIFGIAGFADARKGYIEYGYGYVAADDNDLSYHNLTAAFSKRYFGRIANSVRVIGNFGQKGVGGTKTADGVLLLLENSFIPRYTPNPKALTVSNFVPYFNFFAGFDSPQSLARGGDSGGVLRNTGINFESDGLTNYPTLDASATESYGGAAGLEYLFNLHRQIVVEAAVVERMGGSALGRQYAVGARYQHPLTNALILRLDAMKGWREGLNDVYGFRIELRRKF